MQAADGRAAAAGESATDLVGVEIDLVPNVIFCAAAVPWYFRIAGGLPIAPLRSPIARGLQAAGGVAFLSCVGLRIWAIERFASADTPVSQREEVTALVTDGPYRWTRNPMYVSMVGALASFGLVANTWWGVGAAGPLAAYLHCRVIPREEDYMSARFKDYPDFVSKSPRWLLL
eukprot:TRINITY_DN45566_c0_g1_i1.p1 TRINITY_DN45566_c0_g1~~TRINITY_DN45566_c0_g1_i1.p1  ORF type:complete len:174 (-),score=17.69 TRINITY_DN45566_c0_g1_i1:244-765(-)